MSLSLTRTELLQSQFALSPLPETDTERAKTVTLTFGFPDFCNKNSPDRNPTDAYLRPYQALIGIELSLN